MRASTPGWRDPRLWVGVAIVAVSVIAGARILASADDTVAVWAVSTDVGAGTRLQGADLVAHQVRFADGADLDGYYTTADELPADLELTRPIGAGELLPRAALGSARADTLEVPVAVDAEQVPASVESGSVVDVYLLAAPGTAPGTVPGGAGSRARSDPGPALSAVTVVDAPALGETFGASGKRQLVLAVPESDAQDFFALMGSADDPVLTVVRRS